MTGAPRPLGSLLVLLLPLLLLPGCVLPFCRKRFCACLPFYEVRRRQSGKLHTLQGRWGHAGDRGEGSGSLGLWAGSGWTTVTHTRVRAHVHTHPAAHPPLGVFWGLHVPLRANCGRCSLGLLGEELWLRGVWGRSWVGARQGGGRPPVGGSLARHLDGWASVPDSPGLRGAWSRLAQDRLLGLKLGCRVDLGAACDSAAGLLSSLVFCAVLRSPCLVQ